MAQKVPANVTPEQAMKAPSEVEVQARSSLNLGDRLELGGQRHALAVLPARKTTGADVQETGSATRPIWTSTENLASTEIRSPDRPAYSD